MPFLGGVDEQSEVLEQRPEDWVQSRGLFPQFAGMLARMPGKVAIRRELSRIRSIHQSFSGGSFGFYIESDRLVFFNDCANPRYTVKPGPPASLGTDEEGFTLDIFGGPTKGLGVPVAVPNLNFFPHCIPSTEEDGPIDPPDPGDELICLAAGTGVAPAYKIQTDFVNYVPAAIWVSMDYGDGFENSLFVGEEGGIVVGPGEVYDFLWFLSGPYGAFNHPDGRPATRMRIQEGVGIDTVLSFATLQPPGVLRIENGNILTRVCSSLGFDRIAIELEIHPNGIVAPYYHIETGGLHTDPPVSAFQIDYIYQSGTTVPGEVYTPANFTTGSGDNFDITTTFLTHLTNAGSPLRSLRFYRVEGVTRTLLAVALALNRPAEPLTASDPDIFGSNRKIDIVNAAVTDWPSIITVISIGLPS